MPRRSDLSSILVIGAGPIVIGQACEFDYSGTQAVKALRDEGFRVILVNSNPATIMTDPGLADATYVEPITPEVVARVIERERPDAVLPTMGGQTALNTARSLATAGVLDRYGTELIGATLEAIDKAEDREQFRDAMERIGLECARGVAVHGLARRRAPPSKRSDCPPSSARASPSGAPGAASPTTGSSSRTSYGAGSRRARSPRSWSRNPCSGGRSTRWRSCATAPTTASSSARSKTSTRWACIPATRSPLRRP